MNKREMDFTDIVLWYLVVPFLFLIFGFGIIWMVVNINTEHFTIYKEQLETSKEVYDYCINYCEENPEDKGCINFPCSNLIKQIEFDRISIPISLIVLDNQGQHEEQNSVLISKQDITTEWLDENCENVTPCRIDYSGEKICDNPIKTYKCGDYIVEVR